MMERSLPPTTEGRQAGEGGRLGWLGLYRKVKGLLAGKKQRFSSLALRYTNFSFSELKQRLLRDGPGAGGTEKNGIIYAERK